MAPGGDVADLEYLCLSKGNFEILLRELLLVRNFRVEVYANKVSKTLKSKKSDVIWFFVWQGRNEWQLEYKGSPGNLIQFETLLFSNNEMVDGNSTIAVNMKVNGQQKVRDGRP